MKKLIVTLLSLLVIASGLIISDNSLTHAQSCLGPTEQRHALSTGKVRPFGVIASRLSGELVNAKLCHSRNGLIYVVTMLKGNRRVDAIFNARNGKRLR